MEKVCIDVENSNITDNIFWDLSFCQKKKKRKRRKPPSFIMNEYMYTRKAQKAL